MLGPHSSAAALEPLERRAELDAIDEALSAGRSVVLIEGPPGVGKSTLLEQARMHAGPRTVRRAQASELERDFTYGVARQLFGPALRDPVLRDTLLDGAGHLAAGALGLSGGGDHDRAGVQHGLTWACGNLADRQALLIIVDDLQWADEESLAWLVHLTRRLDEVDAVVLGGTRVGVPDTHETLLEQLRHAARAVLHPRNLSVDGVALMIKRHLAQAPPELFLAACHQVTGGNPFFLGELLDELVRDGVRADAAGAEMARRLGPARVAGATARRIADLGPEAEALAVAVAVLGTQVPLATAAELAGLDAQTALSAADRLIAAHVFRPGETLDYAHPVLRTSFEGRLARAERSRAHRRAAALLAAQHAAHDQVASHLLLVAPSADAEAAAMLVRAAEYAAALGAPERARRFLKRALREPPAADIRGQALVRLGDLTEPEGRLAQADAYWLALPHVLDPEARARMVLSLNACYDLGPPGLRAQGPGRMIPTLVGAREALGAGSPGLALWLEYAELAWRRWTGEPLAGRPAQLWKAVDALPDDERSFELLDVRASEAHWGRREASAADVVRDYSGYRAGLLPLTPHQPLVIPLWRIAHCDQPEVAEQNLAWAREIYLQRGWVEVLGAFTVAEAAIAHDGHGDIVRAESLLREADGAFAAEGETLRLTGLRARILTERGDLEAAGESLRDLGVGDAEIDALSLPRQLQAITRGMLRVASGNHEAGVADLLRAGRVLAGTGMTGPGSAALWWRAPAVRGLLALDRRTEAQELADETLALARRWGAPTALGRAEVVHGLAHRDLAGMRAGVQRLDTAPNTTERARGHYLLGAELRRTGARGEARRALHRARELALGVGAGLIAAQAEDELRVAGGRVRGSAEAGRPVLTPSEERIARLVAEGRSNREVAQALFLSPKTVEMHLSRIYRKLDVSGRGEVAVALGLTPLAADGTSTIVFTDIEGSSELARAHGDDLWVQMVVGHAALVRQVALTHSGILVKHLGDGFMLGFRTAPDAAAFAVDLQRAVSEDGALQIRIGMHTGRPHLVDGDLLGNDVNVAARVAAAAGGGEILCSATAVACLSNAFAIGRPRQTALRGQDGAYELAPLLWG